jgi:hypothetical protein
MSHGKENLKKRGYMPLDSPHETMLALVLSLERQDDNAKTCAKALLRSAVNHLYASYTVYPDENGAAMTTLLVLTATIRDG